MALTVTLMTKSSNLLIVEATLGVRSLALATLLAACSSQDATVLASERPLSPESQGSQRSGTVVLAITSGGVDVSSLRLTVTNADGSVVIDLTREVLSSDAVAVELDVPVGTDYTLALTAESEGSVRCSGQAGFDVLEGATIEVPVLLGCEASGGVRVVGTLLAPERCPAVELPPLAAPVLVGDTVQLAATASGGSPSYAWASSGGTLESSLAASARFTCTEPGPVTLTLTATDGQCSDTASAVVECAAAAPDACAGIGSSCHVVDPGSGALHACHELGHGGDQAACALGRAGCVDACGAELCATLGSLCHPVDPGTGPLHDCHELGHAGDAGLCFERGRECFDLCTAARVAASTPIEIGFQARVADEDFACGQVYEGVGSTASLAEPQDLRFFVSDVRLIEADGREEPVALDTRAPWQLPEVALLDFEDASGLCASGTVDTNSTLTGRVFPGEYVGVAFRVSVPEALNHDDPAALPAPLELGSMSWGWLLGYRFMRAEMAPVGEDGPVAGAALLHLGSTACSGNPQAGTVVCANPNRNEVRLDGFDPTTSTIVADVAALFADTDLSQDSLCHSTGELCAGPFEKLGVDLSTGSPLPAQSVFRLE